MTFTVFDIEGDRTYYCIKLNQLGVKRKVKQEIRPHIRKGLKVEAYRFVNYYDLEDAYRRFMEAKEHHHLCNKYFILKDWIIRRYNDCKTSA